MKGQDYNLKLKIILAGISFALCAVILGCDQVYAGGLSLSIYPSIIKLQLNPAADKATPLTLENKGDEAVNIQAIFKPFQASGENGQIEYLPDSEISDGYKNLFNTIKLIDNGIITSGFELGPKQKKKLSLDLAIAKTQKTSDYYFSVIFLASPSALPNEQGPILPDNSDQTEVHIEPQQNRNFSILNAGIATTILLSIDSEKAKGHIEEFSTPLLIQEGPIDFTLRVKNAGQHIFKPKGFILIKNMFGQTIGKVDIASDNILSGSIRSLTDNKTSLSKDKGSAATLSQKVVWPEKFLLGGYSATLDLALSEQGPIYNQSVVFLALPANLVLASIGGIIILSLIILRIRKRLKMER